MDKQTIRFLAKAYGARANDVAYVVNRHYADKSTRIVDLAFTQDGQRVPIINPKEVDRLTGEKRFRNLMYHGHDRPSLPPLPEHPGAYTDYCISVATIDKVLSASSAAVSKVTSLNDTLLADIPKLLVSLQEGEPLPHGTHVEMLDLGLKRGLRDAIIVANRSIRHQPHKRHGWGVVEDCDKSYNCKRGYRAEGIYSHMALSKNFHLLAELTTQPELVVLFLTMGKPDLAQELAGKLDQTEFKELREWCAARRDKAWFRAIRTDLIKLLPTTASFPPLTIGKAASQEDSRILAEMALPHMHATQSADCPYLRTAISYGADITILLKAALGSDNLPWARAIWEHATLNQVEASMDAPNRDWIPLLTHPQPWAARISFTQKQTLSIDAFGFVLSKLSQRADWPILQSVLLTELPRSKDIPESTRTQYLTILSRMTKPTLGQTTQETDMDVELDLL